MEKKKAVTTDTWSITEVAEYFSVSVATVQNWIKLNKLPYERNHEKEVVFSHAKMRRVKQLMEEGVIERLNKRRNKQLATGHTVPHDYVDNEETVRKVEHILQLFSRGEWTMMTVRLVLLEVALQLFIDRGYIPIHQGSRQSSQSWTEQFISKQLQVGHYESFLNQLVNDELISFTSNEVKLLRYCHELNFHYEEGEDTLGLLYMALANIQQRKKKGVYYTPVTVVKQMVEQTIANSDQGILLKGKIVDPCCGSGNFLMMMFIHIRSLLSAHGEITNNATNNEARIEQMIIEHIICGFDTDEIAVSLAQLNLLLLLSEPISEHIALPIRKIDTVFNIDNIRNEYHSFDIIIGNPPWGSNYSAKEKVWLRQKYTFAQNSCESFRLFLEWAYCLAKKDGLICYVLPESFLYVKNHTTCRQRFIQSMQLLRIEHLGLRFSNVYTPTIQLLARKSKASTHLVHIKANNRTYEVNQNRYRKNNEAIINIIASESDHCLLSYMNEHPNMTYLKNKAQFALGIITGNNKQHIKKEKHEGTELIIQGQDIYKYNIYPSNKYIVFTPEQFQQVANEANYRAEEKLVYRFINRSLIFAYDNEKRLTLNSANIVIPHIPTLSIKFILAVLNSRVAQYYHQMSFFSVKVLRQHIESIPIPNVHEKEQHDVEHFVNQLIKAKCSERRQQLYEEIDQLVMALYGFNNQQKAHIIRHVNKVNYLAH